MEHFDNQIMNPQKKDLMDAFQQQLIQNPYQVEYSYSNIMQIIATIEEYRYYLEHLDRLRLSFFTYHRNDTDIDIAMRILIYNKKWGYEACKIFFMKFSLLTPTTPARLTRIKKIVTSAFLASQLLPIYIEA